MFAALFVHVAEIILPSSLVTLVIAVLYTLATR
jgi:hypothetical protein